MLSGKIRWVIREDEILACRSALAFGENAFALDDGGDESGFGEAAVMEAGEEQAGESGFERKPRHLGSGFGQRGGGVDGV